MKIEETETGIHISVIEKNSIEELKEKLIETLKKDLDTNHLLKDREIETILLIELLTLEQKKN